jgi:hypothetical protein
LPQHSPECPIANLLKEDIEKIPLDVQNRGVDVAVSILIESKDSRILMTKRPEHMRTFPRAWVPPGGHIGKVHYRLHACNFSDQYMVCIDEPVNGGLFNTVMYITNINKIRAQL